jgi:hypothetical protein
MSDSPRHRRTPSSSSPPSLRSSPISRLQRIANHMAPASTTRFPAEVVPQAPEDPLFGLMRAYKADPSPNKVDLVRRSPGRRTVLPSPFPKRLPLTCLSPGNWRVPRRQRKALDLASGQKGWQSFHCSLRHRLIRSLAQLPAVFSSLVGWWPVYPPRHGGRILPSYPSPARTSFTADSC